MSEIRAEKIVTLREAINNVVDGLRKFAVVADPETYIGCYSASSTVCRKIALARQQQAVEIANTIEAASDEEAVRLLRGYEGTIANMDTHGNFVGSYPAVARLIAKGAVYVNDGCLCEKVS